MNGYEARRLGLGAGLLAGILGWVGSASAQAPSREALLNRIEQLEAEAAKVELLERRLARIEAERSADWMNDRRAEQVKTLVREVLADADQRSALMDATLTAGHDGEHFYLASSDGSFRMEIGGQIQMRHIANRRDQATPPAAGDDEGESGFQIRRAKVAFTGHVLNPRVHFALQFNAGRDTQSVSPDRIVIGYDLTESLHVWAGEDKAPFLREEIVSSRYQLAVDRSLVNEAFTLDKVQGVGLKWRAMDRLKVAATVHDGLRSGENPGDDWLGDEWAGFRDSTSKDFQDDATEFAAVARVDLLLVGDWGPWTTMGGEPDGEWFAYVGAAVDYEVGETGDTMANDNWLTWTVDGAVEYQGAALFVSYVGAATDFDSTGPGADDYQPWGLVAQGSYRFRVGRGGSIEPFVRYEHLNLDHLGGRLPAGRNDSADLLTIGGNWYHAGHAAKLTADLVWALDPLHDAFPGVSDGIGLLHDDPGQDDQLALRVQYQLLF